MNITHHQKMVRKLKKHIQKKRSQKYMQKRKLSSNSNDSLFIEEIATSKTSINSSQSDYDNLNRKSHIRSDWNKKGLINKLTKKFMDLKSSATNYNENDDLKNEYIDYENLNLNFGNDVGESLHISEINSTDRNSILMSTNREVIKSVESEGSIKSDEEYVVNSRGEYEYSYDGSYDEAEGYEIGR